MLKVVGSICDKQTALFATVPALNDAYTRYKAILTEIDTVGVQTAVVIKGITAEKNNAREHLVKLSLIVSKALMAYAHLANDVSLQQEVHYSPTMLMKMRDKSLIFVAKKIYDKGLAYETNLANYGVTNDILVQLLAALDDFALKAPEPREAIDIRKTNNLKITKLIAKATDILNNEIDHMIYILPDAHADVKSTFKSGRIVIDYHGPIQQEPLPKGFGIIYGSVTNNTDAGAIEDAQVYIAELELNTTTDEDGEFYFEKIPAGKYTIKVTAVTYLNEVVENVEILPDAEVTLNIGMSSEESKATNPS